MEDLAFLVPESLVINQTQNSLPHLFEQSDLYSALCLSENKNLKVHWADSVETTRLIQNNIKNRGAKYPEFKKLISDLEELKLIPVWIKGDNGIKQYSLYDLYHAIVLPEKFHLKALNVESHYELSLVGPSGPYKNIFLKTWINSKDYLNIIFKNILNGTLLPREFRLRVEGRILLSYLGGKNSCVLNVKQLTKDGILFSTNELNFYDHLSQANELKLFMDLSLFRKNLKSSLDTIYRDFSNYQRSLFFSHLSQNSFSIDCEKTKSYIHYNLEEKNLMKSHYIFMPFKAFKDKDIFVLSEFVQNVHQKVKNELF